MVSKRKLWKSLGVVATLVLYAFMAQSASAGHGGGGGHGGGFHGGGHGGGFHGGGHEGGHGQHPYRPSGNHTAHHDNHGDHRGDHRDHHHDGWHHGGWGPGWEGGWGPVYGGWGGDWGYGGDTVVNNTYDDSSDDGDSGSDNGGNDSGGDYASNDTSNGNNQQTAANNASAPSFPTDNWPELGIVTYAGEYGGSDGQVVVRVIPNSAAAKAGLVPGDVILTFNGAPVPSADELDAALSSANGKFAAEVWDSRTGRRSNLSGSYDAAPAKPPTKTTAFTPATAK